MTEIQIGWKAKDESKKWYFHALCEGEPRILNTNCWWCGGNFMEIPDHPEQSEIDWKDSLKPVYIEIKND